MELFDICDEQGTPTGDTVERSEAHAKGICHRTAHIWIAKQENGRYKVLLQKRSMESNKIGRAVQQECRDRSSDLV